jgi:Mrp family chromosome partitioning ATPase
VIDFRYHLVSLVSVFLALAVGIVLGAGPLKDTIGDTLTTQVEALRQDRDALRSQLNTSQAGVDHREEVLTEVTPTLLAGRLRGHSVVVVRLPGVDDTDAEPLVRAVRAAGGRVTGQVEVQSRWVDADQQPVRAEAAAQLRSSLPAGTAAQDADAQLAALLARAVVARDAGGSASLDATSTAVLAGLRERRLVALDSDLAARADEALVLVPPVVEATAGQPTPTPTPEGTASYLGMIDALDRGSEGSVVLGPASSAARGGVIAEVRDDDAVSARTSTVDTGETQMGVLTCVLALRGQLGGSAGSFGFGEGASDPVPALTDQQ